MEFKKITGGIRQVERRYKEAREKADYVFIIIEADITRHDVSRKLSGYIRRKGLTGGIIFTYFTKSDEFHNAKGPINHIVAAGERGGRLIATHNGVGAGGVTRDVFA